MPFNKDIHLTSSVHGSLFGLISGLSITLPTSSTTLSIAISTAYMAYRSSKILKGENKTLKAMFSNNAFGAGFLAAAIASGTISHQIYSEIDRRVIQACENRPPPEKIVAVNEDIMNEVIQSLREQGIHVTEAPPPKRQCHGFFEQTASLTQP